MDGCKVVENERVETEEHNKSGNNGESTKSDKHLEVTEPNFPYKVDWYQTDSYVVLTVFRGKDNQNDIYDVEFADNAAKITSSSPERQQYFRQILLENTIDPGKSHFTVFQSKLEIKMRKSGFGMWSHYQMKTTKENDLQLKTKNWDKFAREIEEDKLEDEALLNRFFANIYADGSDEVKKAMIKSFTESGGTELNTNWEQVSKGPVSIKPPEGMEWKPWEK